MTRQLPLFPPGPPAWWTAADAAVCRDYREQESREGPPGLAMDDPTPKQWAVAEAFLATLHPRMDEYTCRRCDRWTSADGVRGTCERIVRGWQEDYESPEPGPGDFPKMHDGPPDRSRCMTDAGSMCEEWGPRE